MFVRQRIKISKNHEEFEIYECYEDNALKIEINAEDVKAQFENGKTTLSDLKITYTNKSRTTDRSSLSGT